jgi:hypothetical protein
MNLEQFKAAVLDTSRIPDGELSFMFTYFEFRIGVDDNEAIVEEGRQFMATHRPFFYERYQQFQKLMGSLNRKL